MRTRNGSSHNESLPPSEVNAETPDQRNETDTHGLAHTPITPAADHGQVGTLQSLPERNASGVGGDLARLVNISEAREAAGKQLLRDLNKIGALLLRRFSPEVIEEAAFVTQVRALRYLPGGDRAGTLSNPFSWLFRVMQREAVRSAKRSKLLILKDSADLLQMVAEAVPESSTPASEAVLCAFLNLTDLQQEALYRYCVRGSTLQAIGNRLGINRANVLKHRDTAMQRMRTILSMHPAIANFRKDNNIAPSMYLEAPPKSLRRN